MHYRLSTNIATGRLARSVPFSLRRVGRSLRGVLIVSATLACWLMLATTTTVVGQRSVTAQESTDSSTAASTVRFRVIEAPSPLIRRMAKGEYRPMAREDFARLAELMSRNLPDAVLQGATLDSAVLTARLEGRELLTGSASWQMTRTDDQPTWIELGHPNLAMSDIRWLPNGGEPETATIGAFRDRELMFYLPSSGSLQAQWTLAPVSSSESVWQYRIELPPAPVNRLDLRLPSELELTTDVGVARRLELQQDPAAAIQAGDSTAVDVWQVDLGGHHACLLTLKRRDTPEPKPGLRQNNRYQITERGIELTCELNLDCEGVRLQRLQFEIDPTLRITGLEHAGTELSFDTRADPSEAAANSNRIAVTFDSPLQGLNQIIQISAVASPMWDATTTLPRIRCSDVNWRQEASRLRLADRLVPRRLELKLSRQVSEPEDAAVGTAMGSRSIAIQHVGEEHQVQLSLQREPDRVEYRSATRLRVDDDGMFAQVDVDFRFLTPDQFSLAGELAEGWTLESVTSPSAALDKWREVSEATTRKLQIRLASVPPLSTWQRLRITARRPFERGPDPISIRKVVPVTFRGDERRQRHFLHIDPDSTAQVDYRDDGSLNWLTVPDFGNDELRLFASDADPLVIQCDEEVLRHEIVIDRPLAAAMPLRAACSLVTEFNRRETTERVRIELRRSGSVSEPFHIRLSKKREAGMRWFVDLTQEGTTNNNGAVKVETYAQRELRPERVADPEQADDEVWRVNWPEYLDRDLVIVGERTWTTTEVEVVSLVRVDEATEQTGRIEVITTPDLAIEYQVPESLSPLIVDRPLFRRLAKSRRAFRYSPADDDLFTRNQRLSIQVQPTSENDRDWTPWLTVWNMELSTFLDQTGATHQLAELMIENRGAAKLEFRLPDTATLRQVVVDDQVSSFETVEGLFHVALPLDQRFPRVSIYYDQASRPLGLFRHVDCAPPEILSAPTFQRVWNLWTPPAFRARPRRNVAVANPPVAGPVTWQRDDDQHTARYDAARRQQVMAALATPRIRLGRDLARFAGRLWIDAPSLARFGITPRTAMGRAPVDPRSSSSVSSGDGQARAATNGRTESAGRGSVDLPTERLASDRLRQLGLGLIELDNGLILTTQTRIAKLQRGNSSLQYDWGMRLKNARIERDTIVARNSPLSGETFLPVDLWRTLPATWELRQSEFLPYIITGWNLHQREASEPIWLYRHTSFQVFSVASFLLGVALARLVGRRFWRRAWVVAAGFLTLALMTTEPVQLLAWRGAWGACLGFVILVFSRFTKRDFSSDTHFTVRWMPNFSPRSWSWLTVFLAALVWLDSPLSAQSIVNPRTDTPSLTIDSDVYEVYSPIDDEQRPKGEFLYVPDELRRILQQANPRRPDWVLLKSNYRGVLEQAADGNQVELKSLTADFDLEVTALAPRIQFPIPEESLAALASEVYLDGRRIPLTWGNDRASLLLPIRQAGRHHLQLRFDVLTVTNEGRAEVMLKIPQASDATLVLTSPDKLQSLQVASARGAVQRREATGELQAALGPTDRLKISWPISAVADSRPAIGKLCWLRLSQDEVRFDLRLLVDTSRFRESTLIIEADERLQFDVDSSDQPLSVAFMPQRGVRRMEFEVGADNDGLGRERQATIEISFVDKSASGLGFVSLPHFEVLGQEVQTSVAVSSMSDLSLRVVPGNGQILKSAEFAGSWNGEEAPDLAYRFDGEVNGWVCQGQLSAAPSQVNWHYTYTLDVAATRMVAVAQVVAERGTTFQRRLRVPVNLEVESVQLLNSDGGLTTDELRWARYSDEEVSIFFPRPIKGDYQLGIVATQAVEGEGEQRTLPKLTLTDTVTDSVIVDLLRTTAVTLVGAASDVAQEPDWPPFLRQRLTGSFWKVRWTAPDATAEWAVQLAPNRPVLRALLINQLNRVDGRWQHELEIRLTVSNGVLDTLTLEVPSRWRDDWEADDYQLNFKRSPRAGYVRVSISPLRESFGKGEVLRFVADAPRVRDGRLSVPNVRVLNRANVERLLFLPTELDLQPIPWRTGEGVEPLADDAILPEDFVRLPTARGLRIVEDEIEVERLPAQNLVGVPVVRLADVRLVMAHDAPQACYGMAIFDLLPDGLRQCLVDFPDSVTPLSITVEGQAIGLGEAGVGQRSEQVRRLDLTSNRLPQRVTVLFAAHPLPTDAPSTQAFELPQLAMQSDDDGPARVIDVRRTLVSAYRRRDEKQWVQEVPTNELVRSRIMIQLDLMEEAANMVPELGLSGLQSWFRIWGERLVVAKREWDTVAGIDAAAEAVEQRYIELVRQWQTNLLQPRGADESASSALAVFDDALSLRNDVVHRVADEAMEEVAFSLEPVPHDANSHLVAWLVIAFGIAIQWIRPTRPFWGWAFTPQLICVASGLLGMAWWYWLNPGIWGLALTLLSLFVWALIRWRTFDFVGST